MSLTEWMKEEREYEGMGVNGRREERQRNGDNKEKREENDWGGQERALTKKKRKVIMAYELKVEYL